MKKIILAAIIFIFCGSAFGQFGRYFPLYPTVYGDHNLRSKDDSATLIPMKSTNILNSTDSSAQIFVNTSDSALWAWYKPRGFFKIGMASLAAGKFGVAGQDYIASESRTFDAAGNNFRITSAAELGYSADSIFNTAPYVFTKSDSIVFGRLSTRNFVMNTVTNKLNLKNSAQLSVNGNSDFVQNKFYIDQTFGSPTLGVRLGGGQFAVVLDTNANSIQNGNFGLYAQGNSAEDMPITFYTTYNPNVPSPFSAVLAAFNYWTSGTSNKPFLITSQGYGSGATAGDIILRTETSQFSNDYSARKSGNRRIWLDVAGQGVVKISNTIQSNITTISGSTTIDNSNRVWVFDGSSPTTWSVPTVSGNTGTEWEVKNRGSATLTLQRQGSDQIYSTGTTTIFDVAPGETWRIQVDGTYIIIK